MPCLVPRLPHFTSFHAAAPSPPSLGSVPQMAQAHSLLEDFALAIPGELCLSGSSSSTSKGGLLPSLKCHLLTEAFCTTLSEVAALSFRSRDHRRGCRACACVCGCILSLHSPIRSSTAQGPPALAVFPGPTTPTAVHGKYS